MTFRDLCIIKAALYDFATREAVPGHVYDVATNCGQFRVSPANAYDVADKLDSMVFADRLVGALRGSDAEALVALAAGQQPAERTDRLTFSRQTRFLERVAAFIHERGATGKAPQNRAA